MIKQLFTIAVLCLACSWNFAIAGDAHESSRLTVAEAYKAVPHRRTEYSVRDSVQSSGISNYFSNLFEATDLALVERINGLNNAYDNERYQRRIDQLNSINPPKEAKAAHQLIIAAVSEHKQYFGGAKREKRLIRSSHTKLIRAYNLLMQSLPDTQRNQQAYFDHLCALDFI